MVHFFTTENNAMFTCDGKTNKRFSFTFGNLCVCCEKSKKPKERQNKHNKFGFVVSNETECNI